MCTKECILCAVGSGCVAGHFDGDEYFRQAPACLIIARIYYNQYQTTQQIGKDYLKKNCGIDYDNLQKTQIDSYLNQCKQNFAYEYEQLLSKYKQEQYRLKHGNPMCEKCVHGGLCLTRNELEEKLYDIYSLTGSQYFTDSISITISIECRDYEKRE